MRNADKPRVLVVFNSDYEGAGADPENVAREDIRGTAAGVVEALARTGFAVDALPLGEDAGVLRSPCASTHTTPPGPCSDAMPTSEPSATE